MDVDDYSDPDFVPAFLDDVVNTAPPNVINFCNDDLQCIFDFNQTGSEEIGMGTMMTNQENTVEYEEICKSDSLA